MTEMPEQHSSEEIQKTKWERTKAVMGTLLHNNNIKIDTALGVLAAAGAELIKRVGNVDITPYQQAIISANLLLWSRPIFTGFKDAITKKQLEIILGSRKPQDTRITPRLILDSWKTGKVQNSQKQGGKN